MDFKAFLGDAYREGMSNEELIAALEAAELPEDHSKRLREVTTESRERKQKLKEQQGTIDDLRSEVDALRRENAISKHTTHYLALGYDAETAAAAATALADGDTDALFACQEKANAAAEARWKEEAMKGTPAPAPGAAGDSTVDYQAKAQEAQAAGNIAAAAYYTRLAGQQAAE